MDWWFYLSHFVVKWNLLIRRGFVGREDSAEDVGPGGGSADVRELFEAEGLDNGVEIGGGVHRKAPEEHRPGAVEQSLDVLSLGFDGFGELRERSLVFRWDRRRDHRGKPNHSV